MSAFQPLLAGLLLPGPADDTFATFYANHVRRSESARLAASDLRTAYIAWADRNSALTSSAKAVRAFMEANGHRHRKSSTVFYKDAVLGDFEDEPMQVRWIPVVDAKPLYDGLGATMNDIDRMLADLKEAKRRLAQMMRASGIGR